MQTVLRVIRYLCLHAAFETIYFIKWQKKNNDFLQSMPPLLKVLCKVVNFSA